MSEVLADLHSTEFYHEQLGAWHKNIGMSLGYDLESLGEVGSFPVWLLSQRQTVPGPNFLIAGSFHGEEPCGAWGILEFLNLRLQDFHGRANLSFIPLVNPTGFNANRRTNDLGQNPNCGFVQEAKDGSPSVEGQMLLRHEDRLLELAKDGFLSLHEDSEEFRTYMYSFERSDKPGRFSYRLMNTLREHFPMVPDGVLYGDTIKDGIIFNASDGSYEDRLFRMGVPVTACTETPVTQPPAARIACNAEVIDTFVREHQ